MTDASPPAAEPLGPSAARSRPEPARRPLAPRVDGRQIMAVFVGGAAGTLLRAALTEAIPHPVASWPWPTFAVNVVAALVLGYFATRFRERLPMSSSRPALLCTGFCGGLSTFATMQIELLQMLDAHRFGLAIGYAAASIAAGYTAVQLATAAVRRTWARR